MFVQPDLSAAERFFRQMYGVPEGTGECKILRDEDLTPEQMFQAKLNEQRIREHQAQLEEKYGGRLSVEHFDAFTDVVTGLRFEFNHSANRTLSKDELAAFERRYAADPTSETMWQIMAELTQMGVLDGKTVFHEWQMSQKMEQSGGWGGANHSFTSALEGVLSRIDNVLYGISMDKATDAWTLGKEKENYETMRELLALIAG